jgi:hypothetical protein
MTKGDLQVKQRRLSYVWKLKVQVLNIHFELETRYRSIAIKSFNLKLKRAPIHKPKPSRDPDMTKGDLQAN